jgi:hypothetical protein
MDGWSYCLKKNEWHTDPEAAIRRAEEMRDDKIKSLEKQIAKFKALTFTIEESKP